jgi:hypothetical protein
VFVGAANAIDLHGAEGGLVELDRLAAAPHRELRLNADRGTLAIESAA